MSLASCLRELRSGQHKTYTQLRGLMFHGRLAQLTQTDSPQGESICWLCVLCAWIQVRSLHSTQLLVLQLKMQINLASSCREICHADPTDSNPELNSGVIAILDEVRYTTTSGVRCFMKVPERDKQPPDEFATLVQGQGLLVSHIRD